MSEKQMLGDFIYRLRREKGLSQSELGDMVGVSNKAVSKWETGEANPDISLLKPLSDALGVTADELLECKRSEPEQPKANSGAGGGAGSAITISPAFFGLVKKGRGEFESKGKTKNGTPYVHICFNPQKTAKGIIAVGLRAKGLLSVGLLSMGLLSVGLLSMGLISLGFITLGLIAAVGAVAVGGVAVGGIAVGVLAVGGVAVGVMSVGGISVGVYAYTGEGGLAYGLHRFITVDGKSIPWNEYRFVFKPIPVYLQP